MTSVGRNSGISNINPVGETKAKPAVEKVVVEKPVKISSDTSEITTKSDNNLPKDAISFMEKVQKERTANNIKNGSAMLCIVAGAGTMLATKSLTGSLVGMGIMGAGAVISQGKSGAVAFAGPVASMGIGVGTGMALSKVIGKNPAVIVGALIVGAGVYASSKMAKELEK